MFRPEIITKTDELIVQCESKDTSTASFEFMRGVIFFIFANDSFPARLFLHGCFF